MNLFQLALRQVARSAATYRLWFFSITAAVMVSYFFQAARFEPAIAAVVESRRSLQAGMGVAAFILALVTGVFLTYSAAFFVRGRSRELGLYRLFGTGRLRLAALLALENLLAGGTALVAGLALGVLGSKLFLLVLASLNGVTGPQVFTVSGEALLWTAFTFVGLLLIAVAVSSLGVLRGRLSDVFRQAQKAENASRWDPFLGAFAVVILGIGYFLAAQTDANNVVVMFLVVAGFTVVGVWAFSRGAAGLAVGLLRRNRAFFWKGSRMVALSHVAHRLGSYARVNFVIALVSSVAIIALGVGLNMKLAVEQQLAAEYPLPASLQYLTTAGRDEVLARLQRFGVEFQPVQQTTVLRADRRLPTEALGQTHQPSNLTLLSVSELRRLTGNPSLESPAVGEALLLEANPSAARGWLTRYELDFGAAATQAPVALNVTRTLSLAVIVDAQARQTLVVSDAEWERWAAQYPEALWTAQDGTMTHPEIVAANFVEIELAPSETSQFRTDSGTREVARAMDLYLFAGLFLGLIFLFCAGAVLHFKHLMDAQGDRATFTVLRKIGLDRREERNAALMQILPVYALPLFLAGVNGLVALSTMGRLMDIDVLVPALVELGGFFVVFGVMAAVTTRSYLRLIR